MEQRLDTKPADVFISFTGADREIKNKIIEYLRSKNITCLESDKDCCGDYIKWSIDTPNHCSLFLPIITENVKETSIMKVEYESLKKQDDYSNRIVPISTSLEIYNKHSFSMADNCSAVLDENLTDNISRRGLEELYAKIKKLLIHKECRRKFSPSLPSKCFVGRDAELLEIQKKLKEYNTVFIYGIGGMGKTELAKKYVKEYQQQFFNVVYLNYNKYLCDGTTSRLESIISSITKEMPVANNFELFNNPETLVILDNFDVEEDEYLDDFLSFKCKKIITTRNKCFSDYENSESIKLEVLSKKEQHDIFERHYGYDIDIDDENLNYILNSIAGLTIFISIIAKQCQISKISLSDMRCALSEGGIPSFKDAEELRVYKDEILLKGNTVQLARRIFKLTDLEEKHKEVLRNLSLLKFMYVTAYKYINICMDGIGKNLKDLNDLIDRNWIIENRSSISPKENTFELHPIINELVYEDLKPNPENSPSIFKFISEQTEDETFEGSRLIWQKFFENLNMDSQENYTYAMRMINEHPSYLVSFETSYVLVEKVVKVLKEKAIYDKEDIELISHIFADCVLKEQIIDILMEHCCLSVERESISLKEFHLFICDVTNSASWWKSCEKNQLYNVLIKYQNKYKNYFPDKDFKERYDQNEAEIFSRYQDNICKSDNNSDKIVDYPSETTNELLASILAKDIYKYNSILNDLFYSKPLEEKDLEELAAELHEIVGVFVSGNFLSMEEFKEISRYVEVIENHFNKNKQYTELIYKWYNLLSLLSPDSECYEHCKEKKDAWLSRLTGVRLDEINN